MAKQVIAVIGGSGRQGGGVVDALLASGKFTVRVVSRDPVGATAKALNKRGVEVIKGDLLDARSLRLPFEGAYGAFVVTNFWDPAQMHHETEIGAAAVRAARSAGVKHLVKNISNRYAAAGVKRQAFLFAKGSQIPPIRSSPEEKFLTETFDDAQKAEAWLTAG